MHVEQNSQGDISVMAITQDDIVIIQIALLAVLERLPIEQQRRFRRLAMNIDKFIKPP